MSEELLQRNEYQKIGENWKFYNIGSTTINQLKKQNILRDIDYGKNIERKKPDALIMEYKKVIAVVEYKTIKNFNTQRKKNLAISQEIEVAKKLRANLYILTDSNETLWINVETGNTIKNEKNEEFKYNFDPKDFNLKKIIQEILISVSKINDKILPIKLIDPTKLAKKVWQDIWIASGSSPEICLYTFAELFIFKYLSDLGILIGNNSFDNLFNLYKNNSPETVLNHYAVVIRPKIKDLFPKNSRGETTIINGTIFIKKEQEKINLYYVTVFENIIRKFENYGKLENIDHDFKSKLFETFLKESESRKTMGQFFTPIKIVRAVNKMANSELREGIKICDPACGVGKFPLEFIKEKINNFFIINENKIISKIKIVGFDRGFDENEEKIIILAKINMLIYFCELIKKNKEITKEFAKLFNESFILKTSRFGTLSDINHENEYDLILTNPPYVIRGTKELKKEIEKNEKLNNYYKINAMGLEGLFMEWIIKSLKKNGKAFIIIPDGILNRNADYKLRKFILDNCNIDALISLPTNTFFRNSKKTYILGITKKNHILEKQIDPIFTYLVSEIGESRDVNRFDIPENDLNEATELFLSFKGNKKNFNKFQEIKPDKRCKIWNVEKFQNSKSWLIDKWWEEEDLIEIGIVKKENIIDLENFSQLLKNISEKLKNFSDSIKEMNKYEDKSNDFIEILLSDIFEIKKGLLKYTKEFIHKNYGEYPVYSSQTKDNGIIGKINTYDYDCECLTWTTDGYAGIVFLRKGKFSVTSHCGVLILKKKNEKILLNYLYYYLSENLKKHAIGDQNKRLTVDIIKNVKIKFPIDEKGELDLIKQQKIFEKFSYIRKIKENIKKENEKIIL